MQTLEDLQKIGFHGKNFIQVETPSFFYDVKNKKIISTQKDLDNADSAFLEPCVLKTTKFYNNLGQNMEIELFRKIYNSEKVAWIPCDQPPLTIDGIQFVFFRFSILDNV